MKSKHQLFFVIFLICILFFSCEQPNNEIPVQEYSTPTIKGTVSIPEGKNVNPGDIYVKVIDSNDKTVTVQKVNPDKTFVVQGLNAEMKYSILFSSVEPDFANRGISRAAEKSNGVGGWIHAIQPAIKEGNDVGNVKMKPLGTIRGKALMDGKAEHYDTTVYIPGTSYIAMTSADGTFAIYNVPEGTYTLRYTHDGYMPIMTEGVILTCPEDADNPEVSARDVRLISNEGTVEGVAKLGDANDSSVVSVRLENEDKSIVYTSTSSKEGNYVINNVTPGKYRVIASASGYISQTSQYFTVAPATLIKVQEDILLFGNIGTVKGSAFLSDSDVKSGLSILIKDINSENSFSTLTDDNGSFQKALKPGEYRISANYPGYTPVSHDIVISENNTTDVNFPALLPNSGTITGYSNSAEEQVTVMAQDGTPVSTILSGLDKSYRFEKIPTGTYSVKFSKAGFASYIVNDVNVAPAGTVTVNGEPLKSAYGTISGTSASGNETVSLMKEGTAVDTVTTSSDRSYTFTGLEPGKYSVRFSKAGYGSYDSEEVAVNEGSRLTVNGSALLSLYGSVSGKSAGAGETVYLVSNGMPITSVTTLENREYSFSNVNPGEYTVRFSKSGYSDYESGKIIVEAGGSYIADGQTLVSLYGNVYGTSSSEGETVSLIQGTATVQSVTTGATKAYRFDNIQPGTYTVRFEKHACVAYTSSEVNVIAGASVEVNGNRLSSSYGTVTGRSASAGEQISLVGSDGVPAQNTESGSDGTYRFEEVLPGTYSVKFSKTGYASYIVDDVNVAPAGTVTVNGEPLKSAYGTISGTSASGNETVSLMKEGTAVDTVTTSSDRSYTFTGLEPGKYSVRFSKVGYTSYESDMTFVVAGSEITIDGTTLISIHGSVRGLSSSSGETVSLIRNSTVLKTVVTSQDRSYKFELVEPGLYSVSFSKEGYTPYNSEGVTVSAGMEAIVNGNSLISKFGTIKGVSASSDETVYLVRDGVQIQTATTLENREYIFSGITPGEYSVRFTKSGYQAYDSDVVTVVAGEYYVVDGQKLVSSYGAVAGFVFLSGSDDYSGVTVSLTNSESITSSLVATTASDGSFRITDIKEAGTYLLTYAKDGYVTENTKSVDVTIGSVANAGSVTLKSTYATVKGTIQLEGASTHENITILLRNDNNQYTATTDQKGEYLMNRVTPGTYTLLASKDGYVTSTPLEVVVEPSSEKTIEGKTLSVAIRSVTGSVTLELLSDYSGALITATNLSDNTLVYSAITNSSGDFTLAGMKPGEYLVVISCNGYRSVTLPTINIVSSSTTNLPVTNMLVNRGTVSGTVTLEGRSSSRGIKVELLRGSEVYESTTTDESGSYSFYVPQGNYSGVRYSRTDFASVSVSRNIALFADNYVSIGDATLSATHNTISGTVDVLTTNNEGDVTISFDGDDSILSFTTDSDGAFSFEHIPVGSYVMRFRRTDCSDITVPVNVVAADVISLGTVTITPNTATIKGAVVLKEGISSEGVTVSIDIGGKTLHTTTDSSGRYEIGGVSIADEYTVTYSKDGWNTNTQSISPKLNLLEVRELPEIALMDTAAPILKSVTINNGANTAADRNVNIHIDAEDSGSGISNMLVYDYYNPQYLGAFSSLKDWTFESSNGLKTVYVKVVDRAGNESNVVSAHVTLTDQKKDVKGVLKGENLTWTKDMSPYLVTGNLLVEKDDTLTIQPGVDVQFSGDYYLQVEGKLEAIGTESERIKIYGIDDGANNWYGIKFLADEPNRLFYIDISGLKNGITGYCNIDHALITANGWAVGIKDDYDPDDCLRGSLTNSTVKGSVSVAYDEVKGNTIDGDTVYLYKTPFVGDNTISGSTTIESSNIEGNTFSGSELDTRYSFVYNNEVSSTNVCSYSDIQKYVTYNGCTLYLGYCDYWDSGMLPSALYNIQFNNCSFPRFAADVKDSNFINCGPITVESDRSTQEKYICTDNYWGDINTVEIKSKGEGQNLSFITDYYDNFNKSRIDYSRYKESAIENIGYQGDGFGRKEGSTVYSIGDTGPAGGIVFYDKGFYSDGWRYLEAAPSDIGTYALVFGYYRPDGTNNNMVGTAHGIGSGRYNTERLMEYMDIEGKAYSYSPGTAKEEYAAKECIDYSYGGYDDWFLPSSDELNLMYQNLHNHGLGSFAKYPNYYWSSSEYDSDYAWYQHFDYGFQSYDTARKGWKYVRAVRAF